MLQRFLYFFLLFNSAIITVLYRKIKRIKKIIHKKISTKKNNQKKYNNDYVSVSICSSPVLVRDDTLKYPIYIWKWKNHFRTFLYKFLSRKLYDLHFVLYLMKKYGQKQPNFSLKILFNFVTNKKKLKNKINCFRIRTKTVIYVLSYRKHIKPVRFNRQPEVNWNELSFAYRRLVYFTLDVLKYTSFELSAVVAFRIYFHFFCLFVCLRIDFFFL